MYVCTLEDRVTESALSLRSACPVERPQVVRFDRVLLLLMGGAQVRCFQALGLSCKELKMGIPTDLQKKQCNFMWFKEII